MASTRVRKSILTERWPLRDIYCSQRYADDGAANDQKSASISQERIHCCENTAIDVINSSSPSFSASTMEHLREPSSRPLSSKVSLVFHPN